MTRDTITSHAGFIWSIAELLRGDFKQSEYGKIVLPFVIMRRLDCLLEATKEAVLSTASGLPEGIDDQTRTMILAETAGAGGQVFNASHFTFATMREQDAGQLRANLIDYVSGFNAEVRDIFIEKFEVTEAFKKLDGAELLWLVFDRLCRIDLHPDAVSNLEMGYLFEELIRRFSEISNETAGEHFTPREVVRLLVDLLIATDAEALSGRGIIRRVYDPACGTGGMLSIAEEAMKGLNPNLQVDLFGQELNPGSFAICRSDMLVKGQDARRIAFGNTLTQDAHGRETFHYMLSNPPYGVDWKKYQAPIRDEHADLGWDGRFGAGLPRTSDGQLLFVQHMVSKMRDDERGSRMGIVMNGSPLFTGGAGSGESEIRRWLMEKDLVEAIIALPTDLFYNTPLPTYVWILSNRKAQRRLGRVQLIDASGERFWSLMRKSLGKKRREIGDAARAEIVRIYDEALNGAAGYGDVSKFFDTTEFGYREIRVERPLKLRIAINAADIPSLFTTKPITAMSDETREALQEVLRRDLIGKSWLQAADFTSEVKLLFKERGLKIGVSALNAVVAQFSTEDPEAEPVVKPNGDLKASAASRDYERVPLEEDWRVYLHREVTPYAADAWVDENYVDETDGEVGRIGYEIGFNRYFHRYVPPRSLEEIDANLKDLEREISGLLREVLA